MGTYFKQYLKGFPSSLPQIDDKDYLLEKIVYFLNYFRYTYYIAL